MFNIVKLAVIMAICLLLLSACAPGVNNRTEDNRAGFFSGIWHGWIAPVTLIWQLFNSDVRIYEVYNTGWTYDFGFYMAIIAGFGSLALSRRKSKRCKS